MFERGTICNMREPKPGERKEGPGTFPITLSSPGPIPGTWWGKDSEGRWYWFVESDLVKIGHNPEFRE